MRAIHRRLQRLEATLVPADPPAPAEPASVRWASVLRIVLPWVERMQPTPEVTAVADRVRRSIGLIDDYATRLPRRPWAQLECFCGNCLARLTWTTHGWENRRLAFLDPDYEDHLREIEQIETDRLRPAVEYVPSQQ